LDELKRFYKEKGRVPRTIDLCHGYPASLTYQTHFGTWNNALTLAGLHINELHIYTDEIQKCDICNSSVTIQWNNVDNKRICSRCYKGYRNHVFGTLNPDSSAGLGIITEHVVLTVLGDAINYNTTDYFNSKYDLYSPLYENINVKSARLYQHKECKTTHWKFAIHNGESRPDTYICLGFDSKRSKIEHVWIIPAYMYLIKKCGISIVNSEKGLQRAYQFEVDPTQYNEVYQSLNIYSLPAFCNLQQIQEIMNEA
jgi:hypothetical protein